VWTTDRGHTLDSFTCFLSDSLPLLRDFRIARAVATRLNTLVPHETLRSLLSIIQPFLATDVCSIATTQNVAY
jgi:hypothetical protein